MNAGRASGASRGSARIVPLIAAASLCGDGTRSGFEECDDGNLRDRDGCSGDWFLERGYCGDGIVQRALGETCELGLHDRSLPFACNPATCRYLSGTCGHGDVEAGEECDEGTEGNGAACRPDCSYPRCGDLVRDEGEACDDGNRLNGDGCSASCLTEQGAATVTGSGTCRDVCAELGIPCTSKDIRFGFDACQPAAFPNPCGSAARCAGDSET